MQLVGDGAARSARVLAPSPTLTIQDSGRQARCKKMSTAKVLWPSKPLGTIFSLEEMSLVSQKGPLAKIEP